jgi:putative MATE family efflux protein
MSSVSGRGTPATRGRASGNALLDGPILPTLLQLATPNFAAMVVSTLVVVAETAYIGQLGTSALAGFALVFPLVMLMQMMSAGAMGGGVSSAISRALGAGDKARASALALHAVIIGTFGALLFIVAYALFGQTVAVALGGRGDVLDFGLAYARVVFFGAASVWIANTCASILRGSGDMKTPSAVLLAISALQIVLGFVLGLGLGPIPRLGMTGVALALVISFGSGALLFLWILMSGRAAVRLIFDRRSLSRDMFRDILKVGAVACASPVMSVATVLVLTAIVARFGTEALAGYGIGARLEFMLVPITFAFGVASVPMVGMAIGAGQPVRAKRAAWIAGLLSGTMMGAIGLFVAVWPDAWGRLYSSEPLVLATARDYFAAAGPAYALYGFGLCLYFASQGSGRMVGPVLVQAFRLLIIAIGGWWLVGRGAPPAHLFVVIGLSLAAYGLAMGLSVKLSPWGRA